MDDYIPDEKPNRPKRSISPLVWVAVTLVVIVAGGYGMIAYLRHGQDNASNATDTAGLNSPVVSGNAPTEGSTKMCSSNGQCTSGSNMQPPVTGTVTAVSASSITIKPSGSSTTETFTVTSATGMADPVQTSSGAVEAQGEPYDASDIHVGETVAIQPTSAGSSQAQMVMLNPPSQVQ